jgi:hypothetical protein
MANGRAVGKGRPEQDTQAQQIPLSWRVAKAKPAPVMVQLASASSVASDPVQEVADYYREKAESFRRRPKLRRDDGPEDKRLF